MRGVEAITLTRQGNNAMKIVEGKGTAAAAAAETPGESQSSEETRDERDEAAEERDGRSMKDGKFWNFVESVACAALTHSAFRTRKGLA